MTHMITLFHASHHKLFHLETQHTLVLSRAIADDDSVGNASIASIKLYEVFYDDIEYCLHGPKIIP